MNYLFHIIQMKDYIFQNKNNQNTEILNVLIYTFLNSTSLHYNYIFFVCYFNSFKFKYFGVSVSQGLSLCSWLPEKVSTFEK